MHSLPYTLFVSDLHLSPQYPKQTALFLHFLRHKAAQADALYILGDLFDFWVGADILSEYQHQIMSTLQDFAINVPVYFIRGNRDFLCSKTYLAQYGIIKLPDPSVIQLYGRTTVIMHGDTLCTLDKAYQRFRLLAQNPITQFLFLKLPRGYREKLSLKARAKSQRYQQTQTASILDATPSACVAVMQKHRALQLIHGHVHRPKFHQHEVNNQPALRMVLGDWHQQGSYLMCNEAENRLVSFDEESEVVVETVALGD